MLEKRFYLILLVVLSLMSWHYFFFLVYNFWIYFDLKEPQSMWVTQRPSLIYHLDTRTSSSNSSQLPTNSSTTTITTPSSITVTNITLRPTVMEWVHPVHPGDLLLFRTQEFSVVQVSHIQPSSFVLINSFFKMDHSRFPLFFLLFFSFGLFFFLQ